MSGDTFTFPAVISQKYNLETQNRNNTITIPTSQRLVFQGADVTLIQANIYFSWYNISAAYGNNIMAYGWPDPVVRGQFRVFGVSSPPADNDKAGIHTAGTGIPTGGIPTIPDGVYTYAQLNAILQAQLLQDGNIPTNSGAPATVLSFEESTNQYAVNINSTSIPIGTNFDNSNWSTWSLANAAPILLFNPSPFGAGIPGQTAGVMPTQASVSSFSRLMGFQLVPGIGNVANFETGKSFQMNWTGYPSGFADASDTPPLAGTTTVQSQFPPRIDIVDVVNINTNLVNSQFVNNYANVIFSFSPQQIAFGATISINPTIPSWVTIADGSYDAITVFLTDDNNNPLPVLDPQWSATLLIRQKRR